VMSGLPRWASIEAGMGDRGLRADGLQEGFRDGLEQPPHGRVGPAPLCKRGGSSVSGTGMVPVAEESSCRTLRVTEQRMHVRSKC